ncbi:hypothetical protein [Vibrio methylphosphonaticus]|uniref:hypothetical protein n=1 Tax=Vibrio methylphosphonaticus TaxID=2946866 RepID=UPI00202AA22C|nr:hypothetical protein [Vibrio methylphosphonaticus]MCL9776094.1 hypothetical protein [Vibrio methylphosphonaticus]
MVKSWYRLFIVLVLAVCSYTAGAYEYLSPKQISQSSDIHQMLDITHAYSFDAEEDIAGSDSDSAKNDYSELSYYSLPRRAFSDNQDSKRDLLPEYHLLIVFLKPSLLEVSKQNLLLTSPQLHWTSRASSSRSRVSGWKDTNTLYSQRLPHIS